MVALLVIILPAVYTIAPARLAARSLPLYLALALAGAFLLNWFLLADPLHRLQRYHLYRPSVFVDAYDDPQSRHWLVPATGRMPPHG